MKIIIPEKNKKNILITAALPYVNNIPHLGNITGSLLSADIYARFCRLSNYNVLFISGADSYGSAVEIEAKKRNISTIDLVNENYLKHKDIYEKFNISCNYFGKTNTLLHNEIVIDIYEKLKNNNFIEEKELEELFCDNCNISLADRYVIGLCPECKSISKGDQCENCSKILDAINLLDSKCIICNSIPRKYKTIHYFFKLEQARNILNNYHNKIKKE